MVLRVANSRVPGAVRTGLDDENRVAFCAELYYCMPRIPVSMNLTGEGQTKIAFQVLTCGKQQGKSHSTHFIPHRETTQPSSGNDIIERLASGDVCIVGNDGAQPRRGNQETQKCRGERSRARTPTPP